MSKYPPFHRDGELAAALRQLDVPDHLPDFYSKLGRQLADESRAHHRSRRHHDRIRWRLALGLAAVAVAGVLVAIGIPRTKRTPAIAGPRIASAAEIKASVQSSLAALRTLRGVIVSDGPRPGDERRWRFVLDADGDLRLDGPQPDEAMTYDAATGTVRSVQRSASLAGGPVFYAERSGVAPGPPDQAAPTSILQEQFASFVRALLAARDPRVRDVRYEGRPAWEVDLDVVPNAIVPEFSGDELEITVDRPTALPVRVVERRRGGGFLHEFRIERLVVDADIGSQTFELAFPSGVEVMRSDDGFRRVDRLPTGLGYAPLEAAWIPDGYRRTEIAVAHDAAPTGKEAANPPSREVVSLSYRRGFDQFVVTTRLAGDDDWSDPLASGEGHIDHPEPVTIERGALRGSSAQILIAPRATPHLWTRTAGLIVTVAGDLDRDELLRVAESLRRPG